MELWCVPKTPMKPAECFSSSLRGNKVIGSWSNLDISPIFIPSNCVRDSRFPLFKHNSYHQSASYGIPLPGTLS
eukprot:1118160-Amorphochlora_amoeboformis.AAC.1